ncbi:hypothetical protein ACQPZJ_12955 [Actinoplanes sp. CA-054009]
MVHSALRTFQQLQAAPRTIRAVDELRAAGEQVAVNAAELAALTPQQIQIASMAASGMTDRQIRARVFLS